jgi:tetratricopeptide (TPR) repeat protein
MNSYLRSSLLRPACLAVTSGLTLFVGTFNSAWAKSAPTPVEPESAVIENSKLNSEWMLLILLGEMQVTQGNPGAGYSMIFEAARKSGDEAVYKRSVEVALAARSGQSALESAKAWKKAHPKSHEANSYVLQIQIALNQIAESVTTLRSSITLLPPEQQVEGIVGIPQIYSQVQDKELANAVVEQALTPFTTQDNTSAVAWATIGRMRIWAKKLPQAVEAAKLALAKSPESPEPAMLALELLSLGESQAEDLVLQALKKNSQPNLQLSYARVLIDSQRLSDALVQLQKLSQEMPHFSDVWLLLGAVQVEQSQDEQAKASLLRFLELEKDKQEVRGLSQAYLMLSQLALKAKNSDEAESWLNKIDDPEQLTQVQVQRANLLASKGDMAKARALISQLPTNTPQAKRARLQAEVKLLRDFKKFDDAYQVLTKASKDEPDDLDLRYEVAMMAEKLGRLDEMEKLLRSIIAAKPDFQHAYNALGFSLADRNLRLPEARDLIVKALEFSPEDPYIVDSLGWVEFRMGNKLSALAILERAYANRPDVEIAAHLGEVHWSLGQQDKARKIWREALRLDQTNELLQQTLKRLKVKL